MTGAAKILVEKIAALFTFNDNLDSLLDPPLIIPCKAGVVGLVTLLNLIYPKLIENFNRTSLHYRIIIFEPKHFRVWISIGLENKEGCRFSFWLSLMQKQGLSTYVCD